MGVLNEERYAASSVYNPSLGLVIVGGFYDLASTESTLDGVTVDSQSVPDLPNEDTYYGHCVINIDDQVGEIIILVKMR